MKTDRTVPSLPALIALCMGTLMVSGTAGAEGRTDGPLPPAPQERDIEGRVVEIDGERVKITIVGDFAPRVGEVVTLKKPVEGFDMLADLEGIWKVAEIDGRTIWAEPEPGAQGVPDLECSAVVRTEDATPVIEGESRDPRTDLDAANMPDYAGPTLAPVLAHRVPAVYPELARQARQQCLVVAEVTISSTGDVVDAQDRANACSPNSRPGQAGTRNSRMCARKRSARRP